MPIFSTSKLITIDRHIALEQEKYPQATGEFTSLLHDLTFAIRIIAREVRSAGINDILGLTDSTNIHGEKVRKIDEYANEVINRTMDHSGHLCCMISEESEQIIQIPSKFKKGKYILAFDPLDGSSNIDVNGTIGTIFSLYKRISSSDNKLNSDDVLQPGFKQAAAGYVLYGSSTLFVYTTGNGVNVFTYDPSLGEFLLTFENIKMPKYGTYYSCNEGNSLKWEKNIQNYLKYLKTPSEDKKRPFTMRYYATIVADIHRMLHYGGVYLYPAESSRPQGKIRLLYEANPLAMIVEHAGGKAIAGKGRILDIQPKSIHQTIPVFFGSEENIKELVGFLD